MKKTTEKLFANLIMILIILISMIFTGLLTSCITTPMNRAEKRHYGSCPTYPAVKHYRKVGKKMNPEFCNYSRTFKDR